MNCKKTSDEELEKMKKVYNASIKNYKGTGDVIHLQKIELLTGKTINNIECTLRRYGYKKENGIFVESKERIKEKKEKIKTITITCNMPKCNRKFKTEVDEKGIPYKRRCPLCTNKLKQPEFKSINESTGAVK